MEKRSPKKVIALNMKNKRSKGKAKYIAYASFYLLLITFVILTFAALENMVSLTAANFVLTAILSLLFPTFSFSYLYFRGYSTKGIINDLGLSRKNLTPSYLVIGALLFLVLFAMEVTVSLLSAVSGTQISTNVNLILQGAPAWFLFFTAIIAPIDEEIFFRGFLIKRFSSFFKSVGFAIIMSAFVFGILHASYDSTFGIEIIAAFIFGILSGYVFTKLESLYPSMLAHMILNSVAIATLIVMI